MMKSLVGLLFVLSLCSFAEEKRGKDWVFTPDLQSNPHDCASNRFQYNGANFICLRVDRLDIIRAQRDFHYATQEWYRLQVVAKDAYSILDELQKIARENCRKDGKRFSEQTALCEGSLKKIIELVKGEGE